MTEYKGDGFTQFAAPAWQAYWGIGFGMSVPDVPSPKLTVPGVLDVNCTPSGAVPEVGEAVSVGCVEPLVTVIVAVPSVSFDESRSVAV